MAKVVIADTIAVGVEYAGKESSLVTLIVREENEEAIVIKLHSTSAIEIAQTMAVVAEGATMMALTHATLSASGVSDDDAVDLINRILGARRMWELQKRGSRDDTAERVREMLDYEDYPSISGEREPGHNGVPGDDGSLSDLLARIQAAVMDPANYETGNE